MHISAGIVKNEALCFTYMNKDALYSMYKYLFLLFFSVT